MAKKKHRKLFPMLAKENNRTLDCSIGICDPICPYNCYQEPDYYTLSPWSSPQPNIAPSPSISSLYQPSQKPSSSIDAITITSVTGAFLFILLTGFFLVAKYVTESVNRVNPTRYQPDRDEEEDNTALQEFQVDHPIWFIRTTGLQQSIINSITICSYKRGDGLIERTDCPVCLNEFEEDECLRLLPKCNHAFHISCIDTWLSSHTNCPLCRAGISIIASPGPVDVTPGGSRLENDIDSEQSENRGGLVRESDEMGFKERLSSSYGESDNVDVRIEVCDEINRNVEEDDGGGFETETEEKVRVLKKRMDSNGRESMDSLLFTKTHEENVDFSGRSWESQRQDFAGEESEKENRAIGDEASSSDGNNGREIQSLRHSVDSCVLIGKSQSDISSNTSKTTGSSLSCNNKNKSLVFPL